MPRKKKIEGDNNNKAIPSYLRKLMEDRGTTQQALAEYLGVTRQTISCYCLGTIYPDWETIVKIAQYYNISADWLLGLSDVVKPEADLRAACDYTGLSDSTVEKLHEYRKKKDEYAGKGLHLTSECEVLDKLIADPSFRKALLRLKVALYEIAAIELRMDSYKSFIEDEKDVQRLKNANSTADSAGFALILRRDLIDFYANDAAELLRAAARNMVGGEHVGPMDQEFDIVESDLYADRIRCDEVAIKRAEDPPLLFNSPAEFEAYRASIGRSNPIRGNN